MRIITNSSWRAHTAPIFNILKVLIVFDINKLQTACFIFKVFNQQLPSYFIDLFIPNSAIHNYNTRQASDFHISFSHTKSRQLSIVIYGAKSWNDNLKRCRTLQNFKYKHKQFLLINR